MATEGGKEADIRPKRFSQDAEPTEEPGTAAPGGTSKMGKKGKKPKTANKLKYAKVPDETEDEAKE